MTYPGHLHARLSRGVTLIEMISVVAVLVITTGMAVPQFDQLLGSNRQTAAINQFSTSLAQARYHAVSHFTRVVLCPSSDLESCTGGFDWQAGYITFTDNNRNRQRDPDEPLIAATQSQPADISILTSTGRRKIIFRPSGSSPGSNTTIRFCSENTRIPAKAIILSNTGRARLARKDANGDEISCNLS